MAFREVGSAVDIKKSDQKEYVGFYNGHKEISTTLGKQMIYNFLGEDNIPFSIYGFTRLNMSMGVVPVGVKVRITYLGKGKNKKNQDVNNVRVEVDSSEAVPA